MAAKKKKKAKKARRTAAQALEAEAFIRSAPMKSRKKVASKQSRQTAKKRTVDRVNISWRIERGLLARIRKHIGAQSMESGERVLIQDVFESALEDYLLRQ